MPAGWLAIQCYQDHFPIAHFDVHFSGQAETGVKVEIVICRGVLPPAGFGGVELFRFHDWRLTAVEPRDDADRHGNTQDTAQDHNPGEQPQWENSS